MTHRRIALIAALFSMQSGISAAPKKDLARLAILTFEDQTGTKNYGYLPASLTEAVDKSLQGKFEYMREDPAKSEAARRSYAVQGMFSAEQAADFAKKNNLDIVIYGSFTLDRATREVVVTTYVSLGTKEKFRALKERKNPADATIFSLAEKVADDIVAEMTDVARSQMTEKKPVATAEKLELKKDTVTSWDAKKWNLSLEGGAAVPFSGNNVSAGASAVLRLNRDLWRRLYLGLELGGAFIQPSNNTNSGCNGGNSNCLNSSNNNSSGNFEAAYGTGVVGYAFYPGNRWRIFTDIGAGTAHGNFNENSQVGKTEETRFFWRAAVGVDFLLFSSISLGIDFRLAASPGSTEDFAYVQPGLRVAYVF